MTSDQTKPAPAGGARKATPEEISAINEGIRNLGPAVASMSNVELEAISVAALRERAERDGLEAAVAWCAHWRDRLHLQAQPPASRC